MNNPDSRPEIAQKLDNAEDYDVIFLGFPIWWYVAPTIINTFLEGCNLSGKTIVPFATSGGSGFGRTEEVLKPLAPKSVWLPGKMLNRASDEEIMDWLSGLDLK